MILILEGPYLTIREILHLTTKNNSENVPAYFFEFIKKVKKRHSVYFLEVN